jgi:hypothetical protein
MAAVQNTQFITLRSTDRKSGSSGDAVFSVPSSDLPRRHTVFLESVSFPISFYFIDAPNNVFYFRETGAVTATASFTITPGTYSSAELATLLATSMSAASPNTETYTVVYDYKTGKMTFDTQDAGTLVQFQNPMASTLFRAIGFYNEVTGQGYVNDISTTGQIITSPSYCQAGPSHLLLETSLRIRGHHSQFGATSTLAVLPVEAAGNVVFYVPQTRVEVFIENDPGSLSSLRITFRRDDTGEPVTSFNGVPWAITLGVRGIDV